MRRREVITLLGGAAAVLLLRQRPALTQQAGGMRRIGWLILGTEDDPGAQVQRMALRESLSKLGWVEGRNLRIDGRFTTGDLNRMRAHATELARLAPDVIVTGGGATARMLQQATRTIPIVFVSVGDPAAVGLVQNIARPEANATGFSNAEPSIAGKWLELLKEAAPRLSRAAVIFNPDLTSLASIYSASIEGAARAFGIQAITVPVRNAIDMTRSIDAFAAEPNGGLLLLPPSPPLRETTIQLAAQHRLPAIYPSQEDAAAGGLLAYTPDRVDQYRRAAGYVDRLLRGAKVSELPVQFPTKFELIINLKAAKAIGLTIPETFLLRADEVIE
jgi:putative ABC transport system substrate-binding protein